MPAQHLIRRRAFRRVVAVTTTAAAVGMLLVGCSTTESSPSDASSSGIGKSLRDLLGGSGSEREPERGSAKNPVVLQTDDPDIDGHYNANWVQIGHGEQVLCVRWDGLGGGSISCDFAHPRKVSSK